jgi:hypothetical protein
MAIQGNLNEISLVDIIQLFCRNKEASEVILERDNDRGVLYVADGEVVHVQYGPNVGREAFYQLLQWDEGAFRIEKGETTTERTVQIPWTALVMEALKRIDEEEEEEEEGEEIPLLEAEDDVLAPTADEDLLEFADRVAGFVAGYIIDLDGVTVSGVALDPEGPFADGEAPQALFQMLDAVGQALSNVDAGELQETITLTSEYRFVTRYLTNGHTCLQLVLTATGNLGAARMYLTAYQLRKEEARSGI